jgi:hypothetical protein
MTTPNLIDKPQTDQLVALISESFRVRPNHDPVYVDVGSHLSTLALPQHQVIFGRRGSGKSCLLVHYHRTATSSFETLSLYVDSDEFKRLRYPDLLIRLLLETFENLPGATRGWLRRLLRFRLTPVENQIKSLRDLLTEADQSDVEEQLSHTAGTTTEAGLEAHSLTARTSESEQNTRGRITRYTQIKLDTLERSLRDYKQALQWALKRTGFRHAALLLDDFYLLPLDRQPDVIDYLHRMLRGTDMYMKVGTIRHRTSLLRRGPQTIGVELYQDVQEINLDRTLEELDATEDYLMEMLGRMAAQVRIGDVAPLFNPEAARQLTLVSGGVPRDFLNIFSEAVTDTRRQGRRWLTPTSVFKGAARILYRTKLVSLREDSGGDAEELERVFRDLVIFCLREKRKTAFLLAQDDVHAFPEEHGLIQQLMDFKLIHIIEPDTSAASGRSGRFEAYTLDFALFMEPRLRGIEHVEFWKIDAGRRREGVREAPSYPLDRASAVRASATAELLTTEDLLQDLEAEGLA